MPWVAINQAINTQKEKQMDYLKASFRGVGFSVTDHSITGGRFGISHAHPFSEKPTTQDVGRRPNAFSLECLVVGADHQQKRNALIQALETEGIGELVHPTVGRLMVQANTYSIKENIVENAGLTKFSINFLETAKTSNNLTDLKEQAKDHNQNLQAQAISDFTNNSGLENLDDISKPAFMDMVKDQLTNLENLSHISDGLFQELNDITSQVDDAFNTAVDLKSQLTKPLTLLDKISSKIKAYKDDLVNLIKEPRSFAERLGEIHSSLTFQDKDHAKQSIKLLLFNHEPTSQEYTIQAGGNLKKSSHEFKKLHNILKLNTVFDNILNIDFTSKDELETINNKIQESYNNLISNDITFNGYNQLYTTYTSLLNVLNETSNNLNDLLRVTIKNPIPLFLFCNVYHCDYDQTIALNNNLDDLLNIQGSINYIPQL